MTESRFPTKSFFLQSNVLPSIWHSSPELPQVQIPKDSVLSNHKFVLNFPKLVNLNYVSSKCLRTKPLELETQ